MNYFPWKYNTLIELPSWVHRIWLCKTIAGESYTTRKIIPSLFAKRISGQTLTITTKFINGDVIFAWTGPSSKNYYVYIKKDGIREPAKGWDIYNETSRTFKNALLYDFLELYAAIPGKNTSVKKTKGNSFNCVFNIQIIFNCLNNVLRRIGNISAI